MKILVGTSGYSYAHWAHGVFYPKGLAQNKWLEFYCQKFNCVELNITFYRLLLPSLFERWNKRTPKDFKFIVKGNRFITHINRLKDIEEPLKKFQETLVPLKEKIDGVLWQFPPGFSKDKNRLQRFCDSLETTQLLSKKRHVFEFRDESWFDKEIYQILEDHNFCLCFADSTKNIGEKVLTADFVYLRFHGRTSRYSSNYSGRELKEYAQETKNWAKDMKVTYAFFNNDAKGFAPYNALTFRQYLTEEKLK